MQNLLLEENESGSWISIYYATNVDSKLRVFSDDENEKISMYLALIKLFPDLFILDGSKIKLQDAPVDVRHVTNLRLCLEIKRFKLNAELPQKYWTYEYITGQLPDYLKSRFTTRDDFLNFLDENKPYLFGMHKKLLKNGENPQLGVQIPTKASHYNIVINGKELDRVDKIILHKIFAETHSKEIFYLDIKELYEHKCIQSNFSNLSEFVLYLTIRPNHFEKLEKFVSSNVTLEKNFIIRQSLLNEIVGVYHCASELKIYRMKDKKMTVLFQPTFEIDLEDFAVFDKQGEYFIDPDHGIMYNEFVEKFKLEDMLVTIIQHCLKQPKEFAFVDSIFEYEHFNEKLKVFSDDELVNKRLFLNIVKLFPDLFKTTKKKITLRTLEIHPEYVTDLRICMEILRIQETQFPNSYKEVIGQVDASKEEGWNATRHIFFRCLLL